MSTLLLDPVAWMAAFRPCAALPEDVVLPGRGADRRLPRRARAPATWRAGVAMMVASEGPRSMPPQREAKPVASGVEARPRLSLILPVLDEAPTIGAQLAALQPLRQRGVELIVVDGGSVDGTGELARGAADRFIAAPRGRATQMNAGARASRGGVLLFLHADTRLPAAADALIDEAIARGALWGRFDVSIDGRHPLLRVVERMMNLRSRLTGIATGDQAIFVRQDVFARIGGFPELPLMEDVALSGRLKRWARPACLRARALTSGRRWEKNGVLRTIVLMWSLRARYFLGADPYRLAVRYGYLPPRR